MLSTFVLVYLSLQILPSSPIPHIVWRKVDATDLPANHEISESGAVLHLYNVQYEDVGSYECEAINTKGKDWHKARLFVECESFSLCALPKMTRTPFPFEKSPQTDDGISHLGWH